MGLTDFDLLALNEKGEPTNGVLTSPLGIKVEIYKDWIYIGEKNAWRRGTCFSKPTIMHLTSGILTYKDLSITALRGPQQGIYVVVHYETKKGEIKGMIGCGTRSYIEDKLHRTRLTGVTRKSLAWFKRELNRKRRVWWTSSSWSPEKGKTVDKHGFSLEYVYYSLPKVFRRMSFKNALRFNQGDGFFLSAGLGSESPTVTPVGKSKRPMALGMIDMIFGKKRKGRHAKRNRTLRRS